MAKQLPSVHNDKGFVDDSQRYAKKVIDRLKLSDVEKALSRAYLDGAQAALRLGYILAEEEYKTVVFHYQQQIHDYQQQLSEKK